jgi:hypothetical protein
MVPAFDKPRRADLNLASMASEFVRSVVNQHLKVSLEPKMTDAAEVTNAGFRVT